MNFAARRKTALTVWILSLAGCLASLVHLHMTADLSAFLPSGVTPQQRLLANQLREGAASRLLLIGVAGAPQEKLVQISGLLAAGMRADRNFAFVSNGGLASVPEERNLLFRYRYLLSPAVTSAHFEVPALRAALEEDLAELASDAGVFVKGLLGVDPTGETLRLAEQFAGADHPNRVGGVWASRDGRETLLLAMTRAPGFDTDAQEQGIEALRHVFEQARRAANAPTAALELSGAPVFAVSSRHAIEADAVRLSTAAFALVLLVLWWAYRFPRLIVLAIVPVGSGALAGLSAVNALFGYVHGVTLAFGTTMIGEAVDYAIYFLAQQRSGAPVGVARIWPTLRLGTLTSVAGFSAMLLSGFPGLEQLGVYSVSGLVVALLVTRWVLPALYGNGIAPRDQSAVFLSLLRHLPGRTVGSLVVVAFSLFALIRVVDHHATIWERDLAKLSPATPEDQATGERLREQLGAADAGLLLVARATTEENALQKAEALAAHLDAWIAAGELRGYDTPARYRPSFLAQRSRQEALPPASVLQARLRQALIGLPFAPGAFAPFLVDVELSRSLPLIDRKVLAGTAFSLKLDTLLVPSQDGYTALLPVNGVRDPARLVELIKELPEAGLSTLDLKAETTSMLQVYRNATLRYAGFGLALIIALLTVSLRSPLRAAAVLAPLASALIVTVALLDAFGEKLSLFHVVALLLVIGVGSNYALFFERPEVESAEHARIVGMLILSSATTIIAFGVLGLSRAPVLHAMGLTVATGAALCLVFSALTSGRPRAT